MRSTLLISGLALLFAGGATFFFRAGESRIRLITGISESRLIPAEGGPADSLTLSFSMRLDSIRAEARIPEYKLLVWAIDTSGRSHAGKSTPYTGLVDAFPLDTMKIRSVGSSDYRFRLRAYYPDFTFRYAYSADKTATPPRAPGITVQLNAGEDDAVVTLRTDQPGKYRLDDLLHLGCRFEYYWHLNGDSLARTLSMQDPPVNKVLFAGEKEIVYFLFDGVLTSDSLTEGKFYPLPGKPEQGFTVLLHYPDVSFLQALPTSASEQPRHPVAEIEVWKKGGPGSQIFLYPNTTGRSGGDHRVPGTNALLVLGESPEDLLHRSDIYLRAGRPEEESDAILLERGKGFIYKGKYISPRSCQAEYPGSAILSIRPLTGLWLALGGVLLIVLSLMWPQQRDARPEKDQHP